MTSVVVIDSGVANLASVGSALDALGTRHTVTTDPEVVLAGTHVVLPGVGHFGQGIRNLQEHKLDEAVRQVHEAGTPLLAVCLGMQMLAGASDESPGTPGIGILPGRLRRLPDSVRVPHLGWNGVTAPGGAWRPSGADRKGVG